MNIQVVFKTQKQKDSTSTDLRSWNMCKIIFSTM